jgi:uncharacterized protein YkwD
VRPGRRSAKFSLSTLLVSLALVAGTLLAPPGASATTTREARLLSRINAARADRGLAALRPDRALSAYAHRHAAAMARRGWLVHTRSFSAMCCWRAIGENIAYDRTVRRAHRALMRSPAHRANILDPTYRQVGVGIVRAHGRLWITQVFRRPS